VDGAFGPYDQVWFVIEHFGCARHPPVDLFPNILLHAFFHGGVKLYDGRINGTGLGQFVLYCTVSPGSEGQVRTDEPDGDGIQASVLRSGLHGAKEPLRENTVHHEQEVREAH